MNNSFPPILLFAHDIMVAQYKFERSIVEMLYKFAEHLPLRVVMTMEQVAEANEPGWKCRLHEIDNHFEVSIIRPGWNGDAGATEMIDLTKMKVSKKKDAFTSPKNCFLRVKLQGFAVYIRLQHDGNLLNTSDRNPEKIPENQLVSRRDVEISKKLT